MQGVEISVIEPGGAVFKRRLSLGERLVCGRSAEAGLRLDPEASRRHLALECCADGVRVTDLGSKNGTRVGELQLTPQSPYLLVGSACIRAGASELRVEVDGERAALMSHDYESLRELGRGANGLVHAARHRASGRLVAVKVLDARWSGDAEARARFLREARVRIDSPYVVRIHEVREEGGRVFLVMDLVEGRSLDRLLREGPLPLADALRLAWHMAQGLSAAHALGVIHRDLKPANVLLGEDGVARLADFGIAKFVSEGSLADLTATGQGMGTPLYIAPEQAEDAKNVGFAADLYSLGATLYHLIAGRPPFLPGPQLINQLFEDPPAPLSHIAGAPPEVTRLVARLLSKDPDERPPSAALVTARLDELWRNPR